jgi:hypothetical protein
MEYLRSVWAALVPVKHALAEHADLEAHWCGDASDVRVQVSPLLRTHDIYDVVNGV